MTKSKMANRYSPEVRARAVRMVFEHQGSYETQAGAIAAIAPKIGCIPQTRLSTRKSRHPATSLRINVFDVRSRPDVCTGTPERLVSRECREKASLSL